VPNCAEFEKYIRMAVSLCEEDFEKKNQTGFILPYDTTAEGYDR
jgi:hypothetical protein